MKNRNYKLLGKSVLMDAIGMATMAIPVLGPFVDILWAPIAAKKMTEMFPGRKGKIASVITFLEEILPFTDVIPTFTLMWLYTYVWSTSKEVVQEPIEVEIVS
ncbi:hypothetical protein [Croceibacter atlanticus]|jgi:hypothetical protein|uniref:DUF4112 domain-containing protein n=1 Tax=Croceibacter atlanticus (strain ATCC BAA-628 / JCM 21780 / CIP 108009 / IAM 15332 / KCTC 12090 / HTCC2559) TaxID=216432 RepID=A3UBT6_CROAH|nr:hypothetical protein [Croceibacter atlanticus]EAP86087.1 hypothetical protein CA2559_08641 [Croceibacter atlanticus HTCC2559]